MKIKTFVRKKKYKNNLVSYESKNSNNVKKCWYLASLDSLKKVKIVFLAKKKRINY